MYIGPNILLQSHDLVWICRHIIVVMHVIFIPCQSILNTKDKRCIYFLLALGWASVALLVISLPSLMALGLTPLIPPAALRTFLCPMAAMAVGTLCGDALLHLLPHVSDQNNGKGSESLKDGQTIRLLFYIIPYILFGFKCKVKKFKHTK